VPGSLLFALLPTIVAVFPKHLGADPEPVALVTSARAVAAAASAMPTVAMRFASMR
jgi:hypothetical protein